MIPGWALVISRDGRVGEAVSWVGASVVVVGAYAAATLWYLQEPPVVIADNGPPPAIMIELAMQEQAQETDVDDITPDQETGEDSLAAKDVAPAEEPLPDTPEELANEIPVAKEAPEPQETRDSAETAGDIEKVVTQLENVAIPLPQPKPPPPAQKPTKVTAPKEKREKARPQKQAAASAAKLKAKAKILRSERTAAQRWSVGGSSSVSPAKWTSRLLAHLKRRQRYPAGARSRREQGTAYVRFGIDEAGVVLSVRLARSSGFRELDTEAVAMVKRASPVPAPPPGVNRSLTVPVSFRSRR